MAKLNVCCFYDKVDGFYQSESISIHRSLRAICRGYLDVFDKNRRMNPKEFELRQIGFFDDETGQFDSVGFPKTIDPTIVFQPVEQTDGKVIDE